MPAKKEEAKETKETKQEESKMIEVELNVERPVVKHTIFLKDRTVVFENGKATVDADLAKELKKAKIVK